MDNINKLCLSKCFFDLNGIQSRMSARYKNGDKQIKEFKKISGIILRENKFIKWRNKNEI